MCMYILLHVRSMLIDLELSFSFYSKVQGLPSSEAGPPGPSTVQPGPVPGRGHEERWLLFWNVQSLLQSWKGQLDTYLSTH